MFYALRCLNQETLPCPLSQPAETLPFPLSVSNAYLRDVETMGSSPYQQSSCITLRGPNWHSQSSFNPDIFQFLSAKTHNVIAYFKFHRCISIVFWKYRNWTSKNIIVCSGLHTEVVEDSYPLHNLLYSMRWKTIWMEVTVTLLNSAVKSEFRPSNFMLRLRRGGWNRFPLLPSHI